MTAYTLITCPICGRLHRIENIVIPKDRQYREAVRECENGHVFFGGGNRKGRFKVIHPRRFAILDLSNVSQTEQLFKLWEEFREFADEINQGNMIEARRELLDVIQTAFGLLHKLGTAKEIDADYRGHIRKLRAREGTARGFKILGYWEVR